MKTSTFKYSFGDLKINSSQGEEVLGYKDGEETEIVSVVIEEILKEAADICNIKAEFVIYSDIKFNDADKSLDINNINFEIKKIISGQIKRSESIAVFLCTAGEEIGIRSRQYMQERDMLKGYLYDVVGSLIVEAAADLMQKELEKSASSSGKRITNLYSPGYCGWFVGEQHKLFQLVPDNFCGIRLTESALMDPVKSMSGIIGIGEKVRSNPHTCSLCDMKDCTYRKAKEKKVK